ncbi:MAG: hypothetical protein AAFZ87_00075, partial [Planctomycetota bacterium]
LLRGAVSGIPESIETGMVYLHVIGLGAVAGWAGPGLLDTLAKRLSDLTPEQVQNAVESGVQGVREEVVEQMAQSRDAAYLLSSAKAHLAKGRIDPVRKVVDQLDKLQVSNSASIWLDLGDAICDAFLPRDRSVQSFSGMPVEKLEPIRKAFTLGADTYSRALSSGQHAAEVRYNVACARNVLNSASSQLGMERPFTDASVLELLEEVFKEDREYVEFALGDGDLEGLSGLQELADRYRAHAADAELLDRVRLGVLVPSWIAPVLLFEMERTREARDGAHRGEERDDGEGVLGRDRVWFFKDRRDRQREPVQGHLDQVGEHRVRYGGGGFAPAG